MLHSTMTSFSKVHRSPPKRPRILTPVCLRRLLVRPLLCPNVVVLICVTRGRIGVKRTFRLPVESARFCQLRRHASWIQQHSHLHLLPYLSMPQSPRIICCRIAFSRPCWCAAPSAEDSQPRFRRSDSLFAIVSLNCGRNRQSSLSSNDSPH